MNKALLLAGLILYLFLSTGLLYLVGKSYPNTNFGLTTGLSSSLLEFIKDIPIIGGLLSGLFSILSSIIVGLSILSFYAWGVMIAIPLFLVILLLYQEFNPLS